MTEFKTLDLLGVIHAMRVDLKSTSTFCISDRDPHARRIRGAGVELMKMSDFYISRVPGLAEELERLWYRDDG
jgi:hypothetical protein